MEAASLGCVSPEVMGDVYVIWDIDNTVLCGFKG